MPKMKERKKGKSGPLTATDRPIWWEMGPEIHRKCVDTTWKPLSKAGATNIFKILFKNVRVLIFLPAQVCVPHTCLGARGQNVSDRPWELEVQVVLSCQKDPENQTSFLSKTTSALIH